MIAAPIWQLLHVKPNMNHRRIAGIGAQLAEQMSVPTPPILAHSRPKVIAAAMTNPMEA